MKRSAPWRLRALRQLKLDGRVDKGGTITGKMMVESRPPIQGADPVSGMPRIEFEYYRHDPACPEAKLLAAGSGGPGLTAAFRPKALATLRPARRA